MVYELRDHDTSCNKVFMPAYDPVLLEDLLRSITFRHVGQDAALPNAANINTGR